MRKTFLFISIVIAVSTLAYFTFGYNKSQKVTKIYETADLSSYFADTTDANSRIVDNTALSVN